MCIKYSLISIDAQALSKYYKTNIANSQGKTARGHQHAEVMSASLSDKYRHVVECIHSHVAIATGIYTMHIAICQCDL